MTPEPSRPGLQAPVGHEGLRTRIGEAIDAGRFPQSLLFHGPPGVGKRTLALWTAARLHCEAEDAPCGACRSCKLAAKLEHPDIHYHFPMPRPKRASSRSKLREALETQRLERLSLLRGDPHAVLDEGEVTGIYVAAIENIREEASRRPAMSRRAVFVIAEAERMVPQSSSPEAANAFLKLLEEPPDFAYVILTTGRRDALLPTIRSRTASLRIAPHPGDLVARFVSERAGTDLDRARTIARRAEGSLGRALTLARTGDTSSGEAGDRLLMAALSDRPGIRYRAAGEYSARGARSTLAPALEALQARLRDLLCVTAGAPDEALDPDGSNALLRGRALSNDGVLRAIGHVEDALEGVARNLNPQATVAVLLADIHREVAARG